MIAIQLNTGKTVDVEPIEVLPSKKLAVHQAVDEFGDLSGLYFTLTHIPSGWRITSSRYAEELSDFLSVAKKVDELDWNFVSACQIPSETFKAVHETLDGAYTKPGYGTDFIRVCFSEPPAPAPAAGEE